MSHTETSQAIYPAVGEKHGSTLVELNLPSAENGSLLMALGRSPKAIRRGS